jgi:hypothetical protein
MTKSQFTPDNEKSAEFNRKRMRKLAKDRTHKFFCWKQSKHEESVHGADEVVTVELENVKHPAKLARIIDQYGCLPAKFHNQAKDFKCATGHGVTVEYPSGKISTFRMI